jgi:hypothetical protein
MPATPTAAWASRGRTGTHSSIAAPSLTENASASRFGTLVLHKNTVNLDGDDVPVPLFSHAFSALETQNGMEKEPLTRRSVYFFREARRIHVYDKSLFTGRKYTHARFQFTCCN